jgi:hypothetical protein
LNNCVLCQIIAIIVSDLHVLYVPCNLGNKFIEQTENICLFNNEGRSKTSEVINEMFKFRNLLC